MNLFFSSSFVVMINHIGLISANVSANVSVILYWRPYSNEDQLLYVIANLSN
jgi:hypothetical protein